MKKIVFLLALIGLSMWGASAHAVINGKCDYVVGSTTTAQGFANCDEEIGDLRGKSITYYNALDPQWGTATCSGSPCAVGTGGDDSVPINAAYTYATTHGGGAVFFPTPPSGNYNICASPIYVNASGTAPATGMIFANSGSYALRVLPGCATSLDSVVEVRGISYASPPVRSLGRFFLEHVRLDGYCLAKHNLHILYVVGLDSTDSVYRNVAAGGTNVQDGDDPIATSPAYTVGYDHNFDNSNTAENVNEPGHTCYSTPETLPKGNVEVWATDSQYHMTGINAEFFNIATMNGGFDDLSQFHGWGYASGNPEGQAIGTPLVTMYARGSMKATTPVWDSFIRAGVRSTVVPTTAMVNSATVTAGGTGGTPGYVLLTGTTGTGTKATYYGYINASGVLTGPLLVWSEGNYSVAPSNPDAVTGGSLTGATIHPVMGVLVSASGVGVYLTSPMVESPAAMPSTAYGLSIGDNIFSSFMVGGDFSSMAASTNCAQADSSFNSGVSINFNGTNCTVTTPITAPRFNAGSTAAFGQLDFPFNGTNYFTANGGTSSLIQIQANSTAVANISSTQIQILPATPSTSVTTGALTIGGGLGVNGAVNSASLGLKGSSSGIESLVAAATVSGTATLPSGTYNVMGDTLTQTVTGKSMSGSSNTFTSIPNSALVNVATTVNSQTCTLGSTCTVTVPIATGVTGLGTGNAAALAINSGSAGAPVLFNGAGGTPSSINLSNGSSLPATALTGATQAAQEPAHTGDMTNTAGSLTTAVNSIGGKSVTLGGALTFSGAFGTTFTVSGTTALTLPPSGTVTALGNSTTGTGSTIALSAGPTFTGLTSFSNSGLSMAMATTGASQQAGFTLYDQATNIFQFGKQTDNTFFIFDTPHSRNFLATDSTGALTFPAGTTAIASAKIVSGSLLTTEVAGAFEYDGLAHYLGSAASTRGYVPAKQIISLTSTYTLTSQTAAQKMFNSSTNGQVTLPIGAYRFFCDFAVSSMSASSGSFGFALAGTKTSTEAWTAIADKGVLATASAPQMTRNTAANTSLATAGTGTDGEATIDGVVRVTVAGTVIPQISLTVAAAAIMQIGSFCEFEPFSATSTTTTVGNWN